MSDLDHNQAQDALDAAARAQRSVAGQVGLPRMYWWALAAGWLALGVLGDFAPSWVTTVATIAFAFGHSVVASTLLDGRRRTSRLQVSRDVAGKRIPLAVIAVLLAMTALTIALGFGLNADGASHAGTWAALTVAAIVGFGGPEILSGTRRLVHA
ncbi:hypothetical protein GOEFS_022_00410 [Gordonia effusa NBRC 100432]|uniref:Uncharacterized protein n=1 Tax=Gordonia effusa NBRC 100432 TaxID=1077974 RepID=H0QWQ9_9ACTN|nr:hypothetical protein [Gordonia effusa]GAB17260.1 hypothetical protein GOEFS_022_00410 [Gordonia effusa NBRC 100432]